jgi:sorbitol/mannitol transport system substrate-binding protein
MAFITALANSYGARWFDEEWNPQFDTQPWHDAAAFYVDLMKEAGPAGASSNGFNENLTLFQQGKCTSGGPF